MNEGNASGGWMLVRVEDLGAQEYLCDHCAKERVRYVHWVADAQGRQMRVGCVCAARLTGDATGVESSEREARNRSARFATFADARHWAVEADRQTRSGWHLHWDYMSMVYAAAGGWRWMLIYSQGKFISPEVFAAAELARRDLFETQFE